MRFSRVDYLRMRTMEALNPRRALNAGKERWA